ncbi:FAD-dependent oxidoreductase [Candidatus Bathyarchaeota archaeon]|nr:FAD-dependent oxidoreductase [Candidatus Bathyarchaeota archaeon]
MDKKIIVIGGGAAGTSAALEARKTDRAAEITLINRENLPEYSRCGLPYVLSGIIPKLENLIIHQESVLKEMMKINLLLKTEVLDIDLKNKIVKAKKLDENKFLELNFDSLILATGAKTAYPQLENLNNKENLYGLRTAEDVKKILEAAKKFKNVTILGASYVGMEAAEALLKLGMNVTVIHRSPEPLSTLLDPDMAQLIRNKAEEEGVKFILGETITEVKGDATIKQVKTSGGKTIDTDMLLAATGMEPEIDLARRIGAKIGNRGGIQVNEFMNIGIENIYAAGDCVEYITATTGDYSMYQLGTTAVRMGKVAGANAAGKKVKLPPLLGTTTGKLFGFELASVGLTTRDMKRRGLPDPIYGKATALTKAEYYPGGKKITMKLLIHPETWKIMGAQAVSEDSSAAQRINIVALAIKEGLTVKSLAELETCYAPPVAPTWDVLVLAAESALIKLERMKKS